MSTALVENEAKPPAPPAERPAMPAPVDFTGDAEPFSEATIRKLARAVDPALVEVRQPNDLLYVPWIHYQEVLLDAFGPGGYRLVPRTPPRTEGNVKTWHGSLFVRPPGSRVFQFIKDSIGECALHGGMTPGNAAEGAQSDCLVKCCKALGIFKELFDPSWRRWWQREYKPQHAKDVAKAARPPERAVPPEATIAPKAEAASPAAGADSTAAPADTGEAATDEQLAALRASVKRLGWKLQFCRVWLKKTAGVTEPDDLSRVQADACLAILEDMEAKGVKTASEPL